MGLFQNNATTHDPDSGGLWNYIAWYYMNLSHNSKLPFRFNLPGNSLLNNYATAHSIVRFEVLMAVIFINTAFWYIMLYHIPENYTPYNHNLAT
jgi:hypothetical protein